MDILRTDFDAKFHRTTFCCCFTLKSGSTIIAVFNIASFLLSTILICSASSEELEIDENSNAYVDTLEGKNPVGQVSRVIANLIGICLSGSMLWGNIKGDKKLMLPYVYVGLVGLVLVAGLELIAVLTLLCIGAVGAAFIVFVIISVVVVLHFYYWEVVRCRVLELDQLEQPRSGYTQQDPELPAYEDIQSTPAMNMANQAKSQLAYPNDQLNYE